MSLEYNCCVLFNININYVILWWYFVHDILGNLSWVIWEHLTDKAKFSIRLQKGVLREKLPLARNLSEHIYEFVDHFGNILKLAMSS